MGDGTLVSPFATVSINGPRVIRSPPEFLWESYTVAADLNGYPHIFPTGGRSLSDIR